MGQSKDSMGVASLYIIFFTCIVCASTTTGADEFTGCSFKGWFYCFHAGMCVEQRKICNGQRDCPSGEDEQSCPSTPKPTDAPGCYLCSGGGLCIPPIRQCDSYIDCPHGDDEVSCHSVAGVGGGGGPPPDDGPEGSHPWLKPFVSTLAGVVGGALLCTATALVVRWRRRQARAAAECEASNRRRSSLSTTVTTQSSVDGEAQQQQLPSYSDLQRRPFAQHLTYYAAFTDPPPKYADVLQQCPMDVSQGFGCLRQSVSSVSPATIQTDARATSVTNSNANETEAGS